MKILERKVYILEKKNLGNVFCEFCEEEFEEKRQLELHTFKCEVCKNKLSSKEELDVHLTKCEVYECLWLYAQTTQWIENTLQN